MYYLSFQNGFQKVISKVTNYKLIIGIHAFFIVSFDYQIEGRGSRVEGNISRVEGPGCLLSQKKIIKKYRYYKIFAWPKGGS